MTSQQVVLCQTPYVPTTKKMKVDISRTLSLTNKISMHSLAPRVLGTLYNCWTKLHASNSWWSQEIRWLYPPEKSRLEKRRKRKCHFRLLTKWSPLSKSELAPLCTQGKSATVASFLSSQLFMTVYNKELGPVSLLKFFFLHMLGLHMLPRGSHLEMAMNPFCHPLPQLKLQSLRNVTCDS